jgi:protease I
MPRPAEAFRQAGHELTHVGIEEGSTVKGKEGMEVRIDQSVKDADVNNFDVLFIPGGCSPDNLRVNEDAVRFVREFVESDKQVLAICHAPQIMITADVLRGRTITGYKSIIKDITNAGGNFVDQSVVEDRNLLSSRNPNDIPAFIDASLKRLKEQSPARAAAGETAEASERTGL